MGRTMTAQPATQVLETIEATPGAVAEHAARTLAAGGLVAFPTETVYGLGADATASSALKSQSSTYGPLSTSQTSFGWQNRGEPADAPVR